MKNERGSLKVMKGMREYSWFRPAFLAASRTAGDKNDRHAYKPATDEGELGT